MSVNQVVPIFSEEALCLNPQLNLTMDEYRAYVAGVWNCSIRWIQFFGKDSEWFPHLTIAIEVGQRLIGLPTLVATVSLIWKDTIKVFEVKRKEGFFTFSNLIPTKAFLPFFDMVKLGNQIKILPLTGTQLDVIFLITSGFTILTSSFLIFSEKQTLLEKGRTVCQLSIAGMIFSKVILDISLPSVIITTLYTTSVGLTICSVRRRHENGEINEEIAEVIEEKEMHQ